MIYEIRTYRLKAGSLTEVEKRFGEAYEHRRQHSQLAGFFHTEIGPLNEIVQVWPYADLAERARVRTEAARERRGTRRGLDGQSATDRLGSWEEFDDFI